MNSVVKPIASFLASAKIQNPKCCGIESDSHLKAPVLRLKGEVDKTRVQIPKEDRPLSALQLAHSLATMQIFLNNSDHFAVEFTVSQSPIVRTKLIIGTQIKEAHLDSTEGIRLCKLPLVIPRSKWVQVIIHVAGIVESIFALPRIKTIDGVALMGAAKIRGVSTTNSEQDSIDSTPPGMALFAVPAYVPPIWTTAAKEEAVEHKTLTPETKPRLSSAGGADNVAGQAASASAPEASPPNKLPLIARKLSAPESTNSKGAAPAATTGTLARGSAGAQANKPSARQNPAPYIRFVDKANDVPTGLKANSNNATRRGDGTRERPTNGSNTDTNKFNVSSWEEPSNYVDVFDTAALAAKEGETEEKRLPKPELASGAADERAQRGMAPRRGRSDAPQPLPPRKRSTRSLASDGSSPSSGARRQQRAKTQTQILKTNDQVINKYVVERARLASQVPLNNTPSVTDSVVLTDGNKSTEPICGYGFGYMGLMHENGRYEDEEGDPTLKGVLMLSVDGDDDEE